MRVIDLTDDRTRDGPCVGMISRYPPSTSASAPGCSELTARFADQHGIPLEVIRLVRPVEPGAGGLPVVMDLNPRWHRSAALAAQRASRWDAAIVQVDRHIPLTTIDELVSEIEVPVILCVDGVAAEGTEEAGLLADLAGRVNTVVVHSEVARRRLESEAGRPIQVEVIPHGSPWGATGPLPRPRRQILTWGFLTPGIGAERVIRALSLVDLEPPPHYRLIGVTDPGWSRRDAESYRSDLVALADDRGVADRVEIVPILHSSDRLEGEVADSDLVVVPYDSRDQSSSRILTEAISAGRPVVATAFPGAIELLSSGGGTTVAHEDDEGMADAIRMYLEDDHEYQRAARIAAALSPKLNWDEVARSFVELLTGLERETHVVSEAGSRDP